MITISLRIDENQLECIKFHARLKSGYLGKEINHTDLIRETLKERFPYGTTEEMLKHQMHCSGILYGK